MLEKHDRDRVFITILQTGVMGRVYAMLAPIALGIENAQSKEEIVEEEEPEEKNFDISPSIEKMEAPKEEKPVSLFKKMNPFAAKKKEKKKAVSQAEESFEEKTDDDAFFDALKKSMTEESEGTKQEPVLSAPIEDDEPRFEISLDSAEGKKEEPLIEEDDDLEAHQQRSLQAFLDEPVAKEENKEDDEDLAYPFGGWTDEEDK
jgi:hypothetical protein